MIEIVNATLSGPYYPLIMGYGPLFLVATIIRRFMEDSFFERLIFRVSHDTKDGRRFSVVKWHYAAFAT
ncbi:MAG: hypothetical protein WCJ25_03830 [Candidatus Moraniibacteriota bacterium]